MILATIAGWLCIPMPADHVGRCRCPLCNRAERDARLEMGMPLRHPEGVTRYLPDLQEDYLDQLAERLWPDDEYITILANPWQED
jgi:hypothetical protein